MKPGVFILWRPSFAGSWRPIGEFGNAEAANKYAESQPWKEHGCFTDWVVREMKDGAPLPTPIFRDISFPADGEFSGSTAHIDSFIFGTYPRK